MKKFLSILGGVFLLIVVVGAVFVGIAVYQGNKLDKSSKAYVEANVRPIVSTWSKDELVKRASPKLLEILNKDPAQADQVLKKLSKLGALQSLGEPKGDSLIAYTNGAGKVITAAYTETAKFDNGNADIRVRLIQVDGQWQFLLFNVNSPLMLQ
jgi:predicted PurR-regulated permease PerM